MILDIVELLTQKLYTIWKSSGLLKHALNNATGQMVTTSFAVVS